MSSQDEFGTLVGFAMCAPQNALEAQTKMDEVFQGWIEDGLTEEELVEGKQGYTAQYENRLTSDEFVARQILKDLELGRTFIHHGQMLAKVNDLTLDEIAAALKSHLSSSSVVQIKAGDFAAQ